jgi:anti-sigma factor RsiW
MICPDDGTLRTQMDGELSASESRELGNHLSECAACRERVQVLTRIRKGVGSALAGLPSLVAGSGTDAMTAFAGFKSRSISSEVERPSLFARFFAKRLRPLWAFGAAAVVLGTLLGFTPARTWAQKVLALLRVQKVAVVPIDFSALGTPDGANGPGKMIAQVLSDKVIVTRSSETRKVATAEEASILAGYPVRVLSNRSDMPLLTVLGEQAFQMTLDRSRLQAILDEAGRSDLILPASVDGALITVNTRGMVGSRYGTCPSRQSDQEPGADFRDCVVLEQAPTPTVSAPADLNIAQLAEIGLQVGGMTADQARAFSQTVDWTSTLVIPVPARINSYEMVRINGVQGTLINLPRINPARSGRRQLLGYTLIWIKSGMIYSLTGFGNPIEAVPLAESLK